MADMPFKTIDLAKDRARLIAENKELRAKLSEARALAKNWKLVAHKKREEARRVFAKLSARDATIAKLLNDDEIADRIATDCHDPQHDDRWCSTCDARMNGILAYRKAILGPKAAAEAAAQKQEN